MRDRIYDPRQSKLDWCVLPPDSPPRRLSEADAVRMSGAQDVEAVEDFAILQAVADLEPLSLEEVGRRLPPDLAYHSDAWLDRSKNRLKNRAVKA